MKTRAWMVVLAAGAICMSGAGAAQPERGGGGTRDGAAPPPPAQPDGGPQGVRAIRERIEQRRDMLRRAQERVDLALKLLEEGASIDRVREEYPEFFRRQGGPGPDMGEMPEGGPPGMRWPGMRGEGPGGGPEGPERMDRGRERPGADRAPTDEERAAAREFLRVAQPRLFELLEDLEKRDPEEAKRKLVEAFPRIRPLLELRKSDPELFELRMKDLRTGREAMEAARWLAEHEGGDAAASEAERARRRESMRSALLVQYDARTEILRRDLAQQTERLSEAKVECEGRSAERDKAVDDVMARLIERERERMRRGDGPDDRPPPEQGRRPGRRGDR